MSINLSGSLVLTGSLGVGLVTPSFPLEVSSTSTTLLARFTSNQTNAAIRIVNSSAGLGRTYSIGSGNSGSAAINGFYIYDETGGSTVFAISGSGNVGIGTSSPSYILSLGGDSARTVGMNQSTLGTAPSLTIRAADSATGTNNEGGVLYLSSGQGTGNGTTSNIIFSTAPSVGSGTTRQSLVERMRISSAGNVGIGMTTAPYGIVAIKSNNTTPYYGLNVFANGNANFTYMNHNNSVGIIGTEFGVDGSHTDLTFQVGGTEKMRITTTGNVGIGSVGSSIIRLVAQGSGTSNAAYAFIAADSAGATLLGLRNDGLFDTGTRAASPYNNTYGNAANVYIGSDGIMGRSTSSLKYKKNVENYTKGLNEVMQLRPVSYQSKNQKENSLTFAGLIAEEVHELGLTEFVQYADDRTPDALAYSHMVALLTKAIQEQQATIQELTTRITALENK